MEKSTELLSFFSEPEVYVRTYVVFERHVFFVFVLARVVLVVLFLFEG